jgi:8-oxo-dGTP pyrophosphatase MutT (NUDIX family)
MQSKTFFERARAQLSLVAPPALHDPNIVPDKGDHELNLEMTKLWSVRPIRPAAVLVPVVDRAEPTVLLTQRSAHLPQHPGQISFPGGKIDPTDATPLAAALREAQEEVGLDASFIEPIGYLDLYMTTQGFRIVPSVARISPDYRLTLNPAEVDEAFEVPLQFLMDLANHQKHSRDWEGIRRYYFEIPFEQRRIWGVTAGILRNLSEKIYAA